MDLAVAAKAVEPSKPEHKDRRDWWLLSKGSAPRNFTLSLKAPPGDLYRAPEASFVGAADDDVWQIDPRGSAPRNLTADFEPKAAAIAWPADGGRDNASGTVVFGVQNGADMDLFSLDPRTRQPRPLQKPVARASLAAFDPNGAVAVWTASDRNGLFLWTSRAGAAPAAVLEANAFLKGIAEAQARKIEYRGLDGQDLKAWILLPPGYEEGKKYPMVAWVYAGSMAGEKPSMLADLGFAHGLNLQLLAARGYAVLMPSMPLPPDGPPGADPYMELTKGVLPAVDKAIDLGFADPKRLGVMGQSFGGFSTMGLITQTSRFQAAVALAGLSNLVSLYGQFDARMRYDDYPHENLFYMFLAESGQENLGNTLSQNFARYLRNSPIFYADRVQTPLMIIQGDMDYVAMSQGEEFFMALHRQGKRASFVRYWGEGHVLEGPANVRDMWERIAAWFDEHLKAPPPEKTSEKEKP
jgi:dipeptidyl aminopeptidase/acylaminoacyl peptidase